MHIAIVAGGYHGLSGAYTNARELAVHLVDRGQVVTILAPDVDEAKGNKRLRFARIHDIPMMPQNLFYFTTLCRVHRQHPIDVLHAHDSIAFLSVYLFARLCDVPTVFSVHASIFSPGREVDYGWLGTQVYKFTNRFVARRADRLICVSQEMVRCMRYAGAEDGKLILITNPINLSVFKPAERPSDGNTCLYVGALRPTKGVEYLLRVVPLVQRRITDVKVLIVGDGPERGTLEALSQQLEVQNVVRFLGYITREELTPYYQQANVFVIPSLNEPQGIVIQEAMACGLPVVGSAVGGIPEIVRDGHNGLLVPPRDPQALAEAIIRILSNAALREHLAESAFRTAQEFSWQQSIHKFLGVYAAFKEG